MNSRNDANVFVDDGSNEFAHLFAAHLAPKIFEGLYFELASEQRADAGASETDPDLVNEVSR